MNKLSASHYSCLYMQFMYCCCFSSKSNTHDTPSRFLIENYTPNISFFDFSAYTYFLHYIFAHIRSAGFSFLRRPPEHPPTHPPTRHFSSLLHTCHPLLLNCAQRLTAEVFDWSLINQDSPLQYPVARVVHKTCPQFVLL